VGLTPSPRDRWLESAWQIVAQHVPQAPASIIELGCGPAGGLVPRLQAAGHAVLGVDPDAPDAPAYQQVEFERARLPEQVDAVVACTSLHHVADPGFVIERIAGSLGDAGGVVVIEWDWETFDEKTARWAFERLGPAEPETWLHHRRDEWIASAQPWTTYLREWAARDRLHPARTLLELLDRRFERRALARGPYLFPELVDTDETDERAAIARGEIRAIRIDYVGALRAGPAGG
jgi:SAM-dependent methyltransferase